MSDQNTTAAPQRVNEAGEKFPETFKESLALLKEAEATPAKNAKDGEAKKAFIKSLKAHIFTLQQGLPVLPTSANDDAAVREVRSAGIKRSRLESLARNNSEVKDLLTDYDSLKAAYESLKAGASDTAKAITAATLRGRAQEMKRQADELEPKAKSETQKQVVADLRQNVLDLEAEAETLSPTK